MAPKRQFSLALDALARLKPDQESKAPDPAQPVPSAQTLDRVLADIGPLPPEALFLGMASDGLPVLLNLHNPHPGPMLVIGDAGAGKTDFLQFIAHALSLTHQESDLQYGVVTNRIEEWDRLRKTDHRVGIYESDQKGAQDFILSLVSWAHSNKNTAQSVLVLIDDLEAAAKMDADTLLNLRWLLLRGPARRVWPIFTLSAERYGQVPVWIEIFRTRIFGQVTDPSIAQVLAGDPASALDQLVAGEQFTLRENDGWLRFRLPSF